MSIYIYNLFRYQYINCCNYVVCFLHIYAHPFKSSTTTSPSPPNGRSMLSIIKLPQNRHSPAISSSYSYLARSRSVCRPWISCSATAATGDDAAIRSCSLARRFLSSGPTNEIHIRSLHSNSHSRGGCCYTLLPVTHPSAWQSPAPHSPHAPCARTGTRETAAASAVLRTPSTWRPP